MFTVCPKCALTLVVTAADLRVAQGYVRCGRCSSVFNALARLTDERVAPATLEEAAPPPPPEPVASAASPPAEESVGEDAIPEDALEFNPATTDVAAVFVEPPPNPEWTAATGSFKALIAAAQGPSPEDRGGSPADVEIVSGYVASSVLGGESTAVEAEPVSPAPASPAPPQSPEPEPTASAEPPAPASAARAPQTAAEVEDDLAADMESESDPARAHRLAWGAAAGLAVLVLLAQTVHHHRDALAASARLNRPLTALYAALGLPLVPRWDLRAYDVRQLGASADAAGAGFITVRASIRNAAQQPQPLPLLRVTLQDRFGNRIASGDVPPRFYVPHAVPASAFLSGGQRIDAEMGFADPGANAVGFEIDACLPARGGGVSCANDAIAR